MAHALPKLGVVIASLIATIATGGALERQSLLARSTAVGVGVTLRALGAALFSKESVPRGLRVDGMELLPGDDLARTIGARATAREASPLRLDDADGASTETTFAAVGAHIDVEATVRRVEGVGRHGSLAVRGEERLEAARGEIDVPLSIAVDPARLVSLIVARKEKGDHPPVPARYDFATHHAVPHEPGSVLDADAALEAVRHALAAHEQTVVLPRTEVLPTVTTQMVESMDARETLSSYSTSFSRGGHEGPRAHNIEVAASRLDGVVLPPRETTSFNRTVGPRTVDAGFARAFQIYKGEMVEGVGGGTCQVASTLHAAAVYAGFDVVERAPHSRPLGYVPLGLDATVVYPEVDLQIRNPWNFPVLVHTEVSGGTLTVELRGEKRPAKVAVSIDTLGVSPFTRRVEVHPELPSGRYLRKEKGLRGYDIRVVRTITMPLGTSKTEASVDRYPPTPELFWVAPDFDVERGLPPPPEGEVSAEPVEPDTEAPENMSDPG